MKTPRRNLLKLLLGDRRAAAALEFAIIAPTMLIMLLGTIEAVNVIRVQEKLNIAANELVQMVAGSATVTEASGDGTGGSLADMCTGAANNMLPYNPLLTSAMIGHIESGSFGNGTNQLYLLWVTQNSCATHGTNNIYTEEVLNTDLPSYPVSMFTADGSTAGGYGASQHYLFNSKYLQGASAVVVQLSYTYKNILPFVLGPSLTLTATGLARPRANAPIACTYTVTSGSGSTTTTTTNNCGLN